MGLAVVAPIGSSYLALRTRQCSPRRHVGLGGLGVHVRIAHPEGRGTIVGAVARGPRPLMGSSCQGRASVVMAQRTGRFSFSSRSELGIGIHWSAFVKSGPTRPSRATGPNSRGSRSPGVLSALHRLSRRSFIKSSIPRSRLSRARPPPMSVYFAEPHQAISPHGGSEPLPHSRSGSVTRGVVGSLARNRHVPVTSKRGRKRANKRQNDPQRA